MPVPSQPPPGNAPEKFDPSRPRPAVIPVDPCDDPTAVCLECDPSLDDCMDGGGNPNTPEQPPESGGGGSSPTEPTVTIPETSAHYGQPLDPQITATVASQAGSGVGAPTPTGTVDFSLQNSADLDSDPLFPANNVQLVNGVADWNMSGDVIPVGNWNSEAVYSGDSNYMGLTGNNTAVVSLANSSTKITNCPPSAIVSGQSFTLQISVTWATTPTASLGGAGVTLPTGQVILIDTLSSARPSGYLKPPTSGTVSTVPIQIPLTGTGVHTISAEYQGDDNYLNSTSASCNITVN